MSKFRNLFQCAALTALAAAVPGVHAQDSLEALLTEVRDVRADEISAFQQRSAEFNAAAPAQQQQMLAQAQSRRDALAATSTTLSDQFSENELKISEVRKQLRDKAAALGLPVLARIKAYANAGVDPAIMGIGPVSATRRCLEKAGWSLDQLDLIEANEAFAAQSLAVGKELGWDAAKVNVNGGAIALGHPIGASGCRVLVTLLHEMIKRDAKKGLATLCIGGGQGVALAIER